MASGSSFTVVKLNAGDVALMRAMLSLFGDAFDQQHVYCASQPRDSYLQQLLDTDYFIALAAIKGTAVVGAIAAYELRKFEQERSEVYIYDLAVSEGHRREGIATAMIEKLRGLSSERGASVVFVQADLEDAAAIALYSKLGVREDVLHFDIKTAVEAGR